MNVPKAIHIGYKCVFCDCDKLENHVCLFSCSKCDRIFKTRAYLNEHVVVHSKIENVTRYLNRIDDHMDLRDQILDIKY